MVAEVTGLEKMVDFAFDDLQERLFNELVEISAYRDLQNNCGAGIPHYIRSKWKKTLNKPKFPRYLRIAVDLVAQAVLVEVHLGRR